MTLDHLGKKIDTIRDRVQPIKETLNTRINETRNDERLTPGTKRQEIARHYLTAKKQLEELLVDERTITQKTQAELQRDIFGQRDAGPTGVVSYRDAQDRALRLGPDDDEHALALLISARQSNDDTLATAILSRSMHFGWGNLITAYSDHYPEQADRLKDLNDIERWTTRHEADGFNGYGGIYSVPTPSEVTGLINDTAIQKIADGTQP